MISIKSLFKFVCDKKWHDLAETDDKNIRYCERCQENVHHVGSIKQWLKSTLQKKERTCIAVNIERGKPHDAFERGYPGELMGEADELMGDPIWPLDYPIRDNVTIERRNRHDPDLDHKPPPDDPDLGHKPPSDDPFLGAPCLGQKPTL